MSLGGLWALLHQTMHAALITLDWQHIAGGAGKEAGHAGLYIQESWSESKAGPEGLPYTVIYCYTQELLYTVIPCYIYTQQLEAERKLISQSSRPVKAEAAESGAQLTALRRPIHARDGRPLSPGMMKCKLT